MYSPKITFKWFLQLVFLLASLVVLVYLDACWEEKEFDWRLNEALKRHHERTAN